MAIPSGREPKGSGTGAIGSPPIPPVAPIPPAVTLPPDTPEPPAALTGTVAHAIATDAYMIYAYAGERGAWFLTDHNATTGSDVPVRIHQAMLVLAHDEEFSIGIRARWPRGANATLSYAGRVGQKDAPVQVARATLFNTEDRTSGTHCVVDRWSDGSQSALKAARPAEAALGLGAGWAGAAPCYTLDVSPVIRAQHAGFAWGPGGPFIPSDTMTRYRALLDLFPPWPRVHEVDTDGAYRVIDTIVPIAQKVQKTRDFVLSRQRDAVTAPSWTTTGAAATSVGAAWEPIPPPRGLGVDRQLGAIARGSRLPPRHDPVIAATEEGRPFAFQFALLVLPNLAELAKLEHHLAAGQ